MKTAHGNYPEVVTLGCRLNAAESDRIRAMLTAGTDDAPTVVVNSCAVTEEAVRQTRRAIRRLKRRRPDARLLVTGCAVDIEAEQLAAMPEVDALVPNTDKLAPTHWGPAQTIAPKPMVQSASQPAHPRTRAFVAVQNGCDHACTFCVIPQGRGPSRSISVAQVIEETARHLDHGAPEVVLTGIDVTSWGHDLTGAPRLGSLVSAILDAFPGLNRLRLSSIDGAEIDPELENLLGAEPRVMPHVHLSLQSGDDMILKRMKRRHSRSQAIALVQRLKRRRPDIAIGADLIAGFPTENDAMHANNIAIVAECDVVHGHVFPFSPRPGTPAARMPQVDPTIVKQRAADLRAAVTVNRQRWLASLTGTMQRVLIEGDGSGHAENFAPVFLPHPPVPGTIATCRIAAVANGQLHGAVA